MANLDNLIARKENELQRLNHQVSSERDRRLMIINQFEEQASAEQLKAERAKDEFLSWKRSTTAEEKKLEEYRGSLKSKKQQAQKEYEEYRAQLQKDFEQYKTKILHKKNQLLESIVKLQKEQPPPYNEMPAKELTS